jgi:glycogen synthase
VTRRIAIVHAEQFACALHIKRNRPAVPSYGEGCGCGRMAG